MVWVLGSIAPPVGVEEVGSEDGRSNGIAGSISGANGFIGAESFCPAADGPASMCGLIAVDPS